MAGCGSGGSKTDTLPATGLNGVSNTANSNADISTVDAELQITISNQKKLTAVVFDSIDITTPKFPTISETENGGNSKLSKALSYFNNIAKQGKEIYQCKDGGTIATILESENLSTVTYDNCIESDSTINGQIQLVYDPTAETVTYKLTDYTMSNSSSKYFTATTSYTVSSSGITYTTTGVSTEGSKILEFDKYHYTLNLNETSVDISISGALKSSTVENWIKIGTNKPLNLQSSTCPQSGNIDISGDNSSLNITFESDKSVKVSVDNKLVQEYPDCDQLPQGWDV